MDDSVDAFRQRYRSELIGPRYNGWAHLAFTVGLSVALITWSASQLHQVSAWEWLAVPITFLYANIAEYFGHRGPMHHPRPGLAAVFERHTRQHHRFFTDTRMPVDGSRDFKAVLVPPVLVSFFLIAFGAPVALLVAWLFSANVGWLFALTGTAYFLNYELLHFAYHQPEDSWISRLPGIAWLRRHHTVHHDQQRMTRLHFNISYPIGDWLFGTLDRRK